MSTSGPIPTGLHAPLALSVVEEICFDDVVVFVAETVDAVCGDSRGGEDVVDNNGCDDHHRLMEPVFWGCRCGCRCCSGGWRVWSLWKKSESCLGGCVALVVDAEELDVSPDTGVFVSKIVPACLKFRDPGSLVAVTLVVTVVVVECVSLDSNVPVVCVAFMVFVGLNVRIPVAFIVDEDAAIDEDTPFDKGDLFAGK